MLPEQGGKTSSKPSPRSLAPDGKAKMERARTVADLRPRKAMTIESGTSVAAAAKLMASRQSDAALVVSAVSG